MELNELFILLCKCFAIIFCLPIMVDALLEPNSTSLSKFDYISFIFLINVSNIIYASYFSSSICNSLRKCKEQYLPL